MRVPVNREVLRAFCESEHAAVRGRKNDTALSFLFADSLQPRCYLFVVVPVAASLHRREQDQQAQEARAPPGPCSHYKFHPAVDGRGPS